MDMSMYRDIMLAFSSQRNEIRAALEKIQSEFGHINTSLETQEKVLLDFAAAVEKRYNDLESRVTRLEQKSA